jgi:hypothetical protein
MTSLPQPRDESDFPAYWDWEKDGLTAEGTFARMEQGPTAYGPRPIVILEIDGEERSVWVNTDALRSQLADELERRAARSFTVGERMIISRGTEKKTSANDRNYWPFKTKYPDAPQRDDADLLGAHVDESREEEAGDDGVPF